MTEFHRFPRLPAELRLKIWEYASANAYEPDQMMYYLPIQKAFVFQHLPSVLYTCGESRESGLSFCPVSPRPDQNPVIRYFSTKFNSSNNILYFGSRQSFIEICVVIRELRKKRKTHHIHRIAFMEHHWNTIMKWYFHLPLIRRSPHLEEIILVRHKGRQVLCSEFKALRHKILSVNTTLDDVYMQLDRILSVLRPQCATKNRKWKLPDDDRCKLPMNCLSERRVPY